MQEYRGPVPTPGCRRSSPSSPAVAAAPTHDPATPTDCREPPCSPAVRWYHTIQQQPAPSDHHHHQHTMMITCSSSSSSSKRRRRVRRLPLDVICSILVKLPVRSILRFGSVCKSWNQLISEPTFVKLQLDEANRKPPRVLVLTNHNYDSDPTNKIALYALASSSSSSPPEEGGGGGGGTTTTTTDTDLLLLFESELASNESSTMMVPYDCDGFVLLYSKTDICICNPSTGETLHLAGFSHGQPLYNDPVQCLGFGLDPSTNLHKVAHFYFHSFKIFDDDVDDDVVDDEDEVELWKVGLEVFTLGGRGGGSSGGGEEGWRQIPYPTYSRISPRQESVSVNSSLYWITTRSSLISFDLRDDLLIEIVPPSAAMVFPPQNFPPQRKGDTFIIKGGGGGGGGGDERVWYVKVNRDDVTFDIWEMNNTESWTKSWTSIHRISFQMLATEPILPIPTLVIRHGNCILLSNQEKLQLYDVVTKECKTMLTIGDERDVNCIAGATLLCPSLCRETIVSFKAATNYKG